MDEGAQRAVEVSEVPYVDLPAHNAPLAAEILEATERVLRHGQFILGPEVSELEKKLAAYLGVPHVVTVASGTDALILALRLRGIGQGDEVLLPSHSFIATAHAVGLVGATPAFVDIEGSRMLMDPELLGAAVTRRTRAVIPVHLGGHPCDLDAIHSVCREYGLVLVEDCAQAIGTRVNGRSVGSLGVGCFSLHPLKTLSAAGDAGFITVQEEEDADRLRLMRNFGLVDRDHSVFVAGHSRLDTLQAAILLVKLAHLEGYLRARREHALAYDAALRGPYRVVDVPTWADPSHSTFVVRHLDRDRILGEMRARGFDLKVHYPTPIHRQPPYAGRVGRDLPVTDRTVREIMSLPVTPELSKKDRVRIIRALLDLGA
jgi:dTDP-3-amino-3,4,6-trideoxy-alpha-D-glucose transaminase